MLGISDQACELAQASYTSLYFGVVHYNNVRPLNHAKRHTFFLCPCFVLV